MQPFPIRAITELELDGVVKAAGGIRAHPDAPQRGKKGADYLIGTTIIELKLLDEEGFDKPERQAKLAKLFSKNQPNRPVVILDPNLLSDCERREYRNIIEQPVKGAIAKARQQLSQSRCELTSATGSVLWIFNNGYTALDHDLLERIVANRIRQDTQQIDGVIVSGCYYYSDGIDSQLLWDCAYVPIRLNHRFSEFNQLQAAFQSFSTHYMTQLIRQSQPNGDKFEVRDLVFDIEDIRFVRPAPRMMEPSEFYLNGRPRANSSGIEICPPVALIIPDITLAGHKRIAYAVGYAEIVFDSWAAWQCHLNSARKAASPKKRLVQISVDADDFLQWCRSESETPGLKSLNEFALNEFARRMTVILEQACEHDESGILPSVYILVITKEIGQDKANDVSDIAVVRERGQGEPLFRPLAENIRMYHEHALALAAACALENDLEAVRWIKDQEYCWL